MSILSVSHELNEVLGECCSVGMTSDLKEMIHELKDELDLNDYYFHSLHTTESKLLNGVEETPPSIAKLMVELTYSSWVNNDKEQSKSSGYHHWFDPCVGAGVFPIEIIKFYLNEMNVCEVNLLPKITVADISLKGIAITLIRVWSLLTESNLSAKDYFTSGKFNLFFGDTLISYKTNTLFDTYHNFDMVIGNPPYVRATRLSKEYKDHLKIIYPELYSGSSDLYAYFIGMGIQQLSDKGILTYISPANFLRLKSCENLRNWMLNNCNLINFIDLDETKVFQDASLHAAIYSFDKMKKAKQKIKYTHVKSEKELDKLLNGDHEFSDAIISKKKSEVWSIHESKEELETFDKYFKDCISLKDAKVSIYSGVRTGYIKAYLLDEKDVAKFSKDIQESWIRKIILPANISRWAVDTVETYIIFIPFGTTVIPQELLLHLQNYKPYLQKRSEIKDPSRWYELRACAYYEKMWKCKIAFPDISAHQRFALVAEDVLISDGAYFIDSDDLILIGILNSSLAKIYFMNKCSSLGNLATKGRFRFKKEFVKAFPIPRNTFQNGYLQDSIRSLVSEAIKYGESKQLLEELDRLVYSLYQV